MTVFDLQMIKNEIYHEEGNPYAIVTSYAFTDDVTGRVVMQWVREHPEVRGYVIEVPPDEHCLVLPGILFTFPRVQRLIIRCEPDQEAAIRSFIPFQAWDRVQFARYGEHVKLGIADRMDDAGNLEYHIVTIT